MSKCAYQYGENINFGEKIITDKSELTDFDCGNSDLNKYMWECIDETTSTIHALIDQDLHRIIGVCFLKCSAYIEKQGMANLDADGNLDEENPFNYAMYPAIEILYFAISIEYQDLPFNSDKNNGCLSNVYLNMMIDKIIKASKEFAKSKYVLLYSVTDAYCFYSRNNFCDFNDIAITDCDERLIDCKPMFLEISDD